MTLALAVALGLVVGAVLGTLGGGGSVLAVPALVYLLGQTTTAATTGSLLVVMVAAVAGLTVHGRAGAVRVQDGLVFGALGSTGALAGSVASGAVDPDLLLALFAALLLAVGTVLLRRARGGESDVAGRPRGRSWVRLVAMAIGLLTGLFGVGGGFVVVPALVLVLGLDMHAAVGTSLLVVLVNSLVALATRLVGGSEVDLAVVVPFAAAAALAGLAGSRVSQRVRGERLQQAFAALLVVLALAVWADTLPAVLG